MTLTFITKDVFWLAYANKIIFVNLPVSDVAKTKAFFLALGYEHNPHFSNELAVSIIIGPNIYAMMLSHEHYSQFIVKPIADATKMNELIISLAAETRDEVDELVARAIAAGGTVFKEPMDLGFMYQHAFYDLDGHQWEIVWMDPAAIPGHES